MLQGPDMNCPLVFLLSLGNHHPQKRQIRNQDTKIHQTKQQKTPAFPTVEKPLLAITKDFPLNLPALLSASPASVYWFTVYDSGYTHLDPQIPPKKCVLFVCLSPTSMGYNLIQHHFYVVKYNFLWSKPTIFYGCSEGRYDYPQIATVSDKKTVKWSARHLCHAEGAKKIKNLSDEGSYYSSYYSWSLRVYIYIYMYICVYIYIYYHHYNLTYPTLHNYYINYIYITIIIVLHCNNDYIQP